VTNFLQFTITLRKSDRQPQGTLQLKCQDHMFVRLQRHPKCKRAVLLVYPTFFCKFLFKSNPTKKSITDSNARFKQIRIRHLFLWNFFLIMFNIISSKNIDLFPWITQYLPRYNCRTLRTWRNNIQDKKFSWKGHEVNYFWKVTSFGLVESYERKGRLRVFSKEPLLQELGNYSTWTETS
jgi:hypothetical protein